MAVAKQKPSELQSLQDALFAYAKSEKTAKDTRSLVSSIQETGLKEIMRVYSSEAGFRGAWHSAMGTTGQDNELLRSLCRSTFTGFFGEFPVTMVKGLGAAAVAIPGAIKKASVDKIGGWAWNVVTNPIDSSLSLLYTITSVRSWQDFDKAYSDAVNKKDPFSIQNALLRRQTALFDLGLAIATLGAGGAIKTLVKSAIEAPKERALIYTSKLAEEIYARNAAAGMTREMALQEAQNFVKTGRAAKGIVDDAILASAKVPLRSGAWAAFKKETWVLDYYAYRAERKKLLAEIASSKTDEELVANVAKLAEKEIEYQKHRKLLAVPVPAGEWTKKNYSWPISWERVKLAGQKEGAAAAKATAESFRAQRKRLKESIKAVDSDLAKLRGELAKEGSDVKKLQEQIARKQASKDVMANELATMNYRVGAAILDGLEKFPTLKVFLNKEMREELQKSFSKFLRTAKESVLLNREIEKLSEQVLKATGPEQVKLAKVLKSMQLQRESLLTVTKDSAKFLGLEGLEFLLGHFVFLLNLIAAGLTATVAYPVKVMAGRPGPFILDLAAQQLTRDLTTLELMTPEQIQKMKNDLASREKQLRAELADAEKELKGASSETEKRVLRENIGRLKKELGD